MAKLIEWLKNNKLTAVLLLIVAYFLIKNQQGIVPVARRGNYEAALPAAGGGLLTAERIMPVSETAPSPEVKDRMVAEESNISMVVDNVRQEVDRIISYIEQKGGYMVSSSISQPQEAPFATLVVRVPSNELRSTLEHLRDLAVKVTSENLKGWDVTDKYVDLEARLKTLYKTKTKFEEIMDEAVKIDDILRVQRELISLQQQIDNLKGQQEYLKKTAENAKLTAYFSTDEWSLPYTPEKPSFRPKVIFKQAVRSLVLSLRSAAKAGIWLAVYSIVWLPILAVWYFWKRKKS